MLLASFLDVVMAPMRRYTKVRLTTVAFGGLAFFLALVFLQGGSNAERVKSLASGFELLGQRSFLIRGGWEMWKDNPLVGVGSGNYQNTLLISYLWTLPDWATTTLSHTSLISILAELGIVGVGLITFFSVRMVVACRAAFLASDERYSRLMVAWCAAALVEILFQSQSEGRLLDEPFLYVILAILVALEVGAGARGPDPVVESAESVVERTSRRRQKRGRPRPPAPIPVAASATDLTT
jgi:O-antigen ligase